MANIFRLCMAHMVESNFHILKLKQSSFESIFSKVTTGFGYFKNGITLKVFVRLKLKSNKFR